MNTTMISQNILEQYIEFFHVFFLMFRQIFILLLFIFEKYENTS